MEGLRHQPARFLPRLAFQPLRSNARFSRPTFHGLMVALYSRCRQLDGTCSKFLALVCIPVKLSHCEDLLERTFFLTSPGRQLYDSRCYVLLRRTKTCPYTVARPGSLSTNRDIPAFGIDYSTLSRRCKGERDPHPASKALSTPGV
jgi:hypothetical protein